VQNGFNGMLPQDSQYQLPIGYVSNHERRTASQLPPATDEIV
jgi:hypothetical protein